MLSGDQVLEWNGVPLSGKTYEEVQNIVSQRNGEIEIVVKPLVALVTSFLVFYHWPMNELVQKR